ncbi:hypothetical protein HOLleu_25065 [Holothuria leucospilota]|uniref:Uncharacterized protein n=1 Tax=Holothuria leucospilota TaxID=206669 RepID=A0A9Q1BSI5_HOLLE|nr:hypothetical protein HOLleu_25065 [Holothuria leucospilota]
MKKSVTLPSGYFTLGASPTPGHFWIGCGRDNMLNARDTIIAEKRRCLYLAAALAIVEEQQKRLEEAEEQEKATPPRKKTQRKV